MVAGESNWDMTKIRTLLPAYETTILCLKPSLTGAPDKLVWLGTKTGEYTSKSGYFTTIVDTNGGNPTEPGFNWKKNVWNLECAPKVKHCSWRVLKGAILVGARLVKRHRC